MLLINISKDVLFYVMSKEKIYRLTENDICKIVARAVEDIKCNGKRRIDERVAMIRKIAFDSDCLLEYKQMKSVSDIPSETAVRIILDSLPDLKSFEPTDDNIRIVKRYKDADTGFWLFAEYFMKQDEPMDKALSLKYVGSDNVLASYEIRRPVNNDPDILWIVDVQSKQKGGLTEILDFVVDYCIDNGIEYIGLQAYDDNIKDMYINRFGFEDVDWFLLKKI